MDSGHLYVYSIVCALFYVHFTCFADGVFDFMDTYEQRSLKLKIEKHNLDLDIEKLEKQLHEVRE